MSPFLLSLCLPFLAAALLPLLRGRAGAWAGWGAVATALGAAWGIWQTSGLAGGAAAVVPVLQAWDWVPELGLRLSFRVDGLSVFFGLVVTLMGALIAGYAIAYFHGAEKRPGRFFSYFCLFMGAMLATVFANNLLVLFIAWELTGIASFLLIGYQHEEKAESRRGARMALLTTVGGGLVMLVGVVLLGRIHGTFELDRILGAVVPSGSDGLLTAAFGCVLVGILSKSAQFPFQYWLPNAMAAPTPVSAYLHSATMVKLGVFLTARLLPVFGGLDAWTPTLVLFGFGTMLLGAFLAVRSHDLKAVLAHSTVSQLGLLIGSYGLWNAGDEGRAAVEWDYVHIASHVLYKAALFMVVGIIDHAAGTRDLRSLGGLARRMPLTALAAGLALAASAGVPLTTGFLSKELLLKQCIGFLDTNGGWLGVWVLATVLAAAVLKVAFSLGIFVRAFLGREPRALSAHWHAPSLAVQAAPLVLALATIAFGCAAGAFGKLGALFAVDGLHHSAPAELGLGKLLGHISPALLWSLGALAAGTVLCLWLLRRGWDRAEVPASLRWDGAFDRVIDGLPAVGKALTHALGAGRPSRFIGIVLCVVVGVVVLLLARLDAPLLHWLREEALPLPAGPQGSVRWFLLAVAAVGVGALLAARGVLARLLSLSVVGMVVTVFFGFYHAPDLALTQILVESASLLLVMLIVFRLRRGGVELDEGSDGGRWRLVPAVLGALAFGACALVFQSPDHSAHAGQSVLATTLEFARGANAVNTVLVDYRGFDTLLEVTVLLIAALGCLGLLMRRRATGSARRRAVSAVDLFPVADNFVLRCAGLALAALLNLLAAHLFFRGHNAPGGGFIAGLVTALSILLLGYILGVKRAARVLPGHGIALASAGVALAVGTGLAGPAFGLPFLYHFHGYAPELPLVGRFAVGTPMLFDLGVYLAVVGVTLKLVFPLMKSVHGLPAFAADEERRYASSEDEPLELEPQREGRGAQ